VSYFFFKNKLSTIKLDLSQVNFIRKLILDLIKLKKEKINFSLY